MDVSELRKRIIRALEEARSVAGSRRGVVDAARRDYTAFLETVAVPLLRQAATVLKAQGHPFTLETPAETARIVADGAPQTFLELSLQIDGDDPRVMGRVSVSRGRQGLVIEERPLATVPISEITENHVADFLVREIPTLIVKR
jgi:hypothetical protein